MQFIIGPTLNFDELSKPATVLRCLNVMSCSLMGFVSAFE